VGWGGGSECRRLRSPAGGRGPRQGGVGKVFKCVGLAAEREGSRLLRPEGKGTEEVVAARHRCVLVAVVMEEDGWKKIRPAVVQKDKKISIQRENISSPGICRQYQIHCT
jgi:hypothetical protein